MDKYNTMIGVWCCMCFKTVVQKYNKWKKVGEQQSYMFLLYCTTVKHPYKALSI